MNRLLKCIGVGLCFTGLMGCSSTSEIRPRGGITQPAVGSVLYCGTVQPGCEDVATDTLEIRFPSKGRIEIIRQYHGSALPITSAFVGEFETLENLVGQSDSKLTEQNWRQELPHDYSGTVSVSVQCKSPDSLQGCVASGRPLSGNIAKAPGWENQGYTNYPVNLPCNTQAIQVLDGPDCSEE